MASDTLTFGCVGSVPARLLIDSPTGFNVEREIRWETFDSDLQGKSFQFGSLTLRLSPWTIDRTEGDLPNGDVRLLARLPLAEEDTSIKSLYDLVRPAHQKLAKSRTKLKVADENIMAIDKVLRGLVAITIQLHRGGRSIGLVDPFNVFCVIKDGEVKDVILPDVGYSRRGVGNVEDWLNPNERWKGKAISSETLKSLFGDYSLQDHADLIHENRNAYQWAEVLGLARLLNWVVRGQIDKTIPAEADINAGSWDFLRLFIGAGDNPADPIARAKNRVGPELMKQGRSKKDAIEMVERPALALQYFLQKASFTNHLLSPADGVQRVRESTGAKIPWLWIAGALAFSLVVVGAFLFLLSSDDWVPRQPEVAWYCTDCQKDSGIGQALEEIRPAFERYDDGIKKQLIDDQYIARLGQLEVRSLFQMLDQQYEGIEEVRGIAKASQVDSDTNLECVSKLEKLFEENVGKQWQLLRTYKKFTEAPTALREFYDKQSNLLTIVKELRGGEPPSWEADFQRRYQIVEKL